jgi:hypothetical protein
VLVDVDIEAEDIDSQLNLFKAEELLGAGIAQQTTEPIWIDAKKQLNLRMKKSYMI